MDDRWMDELKDLRGVLQPTEMALPAVQAGVRRRRRLRVLIAIGGTSCLVAAATFGAVALAGQEQDSGSGPIASTASATPEPTPPPGTVSPNFDCGHGADRIDIFTSAPPPITDREEQLRLIDKVRAQEWTGFKVVGAEPTHLGVVALVTGSFEKAHHDLLPQGVRQVALSAHELGSAHEQAMNFIQELLEPAINDVERIRRNNAGYASVGLWQEAGAIVVDWKSPIPAEVQALARVRPDGVRVIVQPARYSERDVNRATNRVLAAFDAHRVDAQWSSATGCDDGSGLVLGIQPGSSLGDRKAALEEQLSEIAQMPVHVLEQEPPSAL